jgi:hypothetical protein
MADFDPRAPSIARVYEYGGTGERWQYSDRQN